MNSRILFFAFFLGAFMCFVSCDDLTVPSKSKIIKETPTILASEEVKPNFIGCGYNYMIEKNQFTLNTPKKREIDQIQKILSFIGLPMNFEIYSEANTQNAAAIIIDNKRYIIYDPQLFEYADNSSGSYWSSMSILAHEIGHHFSGHTLDNYEANPMKELEADKFSGFTLHKMGASLDQACIAMNLLGSNTGSATHPSKSRRIEAITNGWKEAEKLRFESAIPPPPIDENDDNEFWGQEEFSIEELIFPEALNSTEFSYYLDYENRPIYEGIILDKIIEDPSNGAFARNFGHEPSNFNYQLPIYITKVENDTGSDIDHLGKRKMFYLLEFHSQLDTYSHRSIHDLLVPGRKIRFKVFYYGYGAPQIIYLKKLERL